MKFKKPKGFSLVELMIVIAILAILAAVAVPSFQRFAINSDLKTAAREIQGDFFICKERAIAENEQYEIRFDIGNKSYEVVRLSDLAIIKSHTQTRDKILSLRGAIIFASATATEFTFQPRGTVTAGTIVLKNNRDSTATITTNITGKTYVQFNLQ